MVTAESGIYLTQCNYVVLKKFAYPAGLYGGNSATFYIPQGVPLPAGNSGHSRIYDLNSISLECSLDSACGKEMTDGTIGTGATQSSYRVDSGGAISPVNMKAPEPRAMARRQAAPAASGIAPSTSNPFEKIFEASAAAVTQGAELHAIGVYEGPVHFGKEVEDPSASTITVNVRAKGKPVVLALFSYDPVIWNIIPGAGVVLKEIILSGYTQAKVEGVDRKTVRVTPQSMGLAYDNPTAKVVAPVLMKYTGLSLNSFQVKYKGTEFVVGSE